MFRNKSILKLKKVVYFVVVNDSLNLVQLGQILCLLISGVRICYVIGILRASVVLRKVEFR